jgi:hypothetical protein
MVQLPSGSRFCFAVPVALDNYHEPKVGNVSHPVGFYGKTRRLIGGTIHMWDSSIVYDREHLPAGASVFLQNTQ